MNPLLITLHFIFNTNELQNLTLISVQTGGVPSE